MHPDTQAGSRESDSIDDRLRRLRSRISDLGSEVDADRAGIAASMGGGVFLILLAGLAAYDYLGGKAGVWSSVGISSEMLKWVAVVFGAVGLGLIARGIVVRRRGETEREAELAALEQEYTALLDHKKSVDGAAQGEK